MTEEVYKDGMRANGTARSKSHKTGEAIRNAGRSARDRAADAIAHGRDSAQSAVKGGRRKAGVLYEESRDKAERASEAIENNPLAVLAGGLAVGALLGALIPRPEFERSALSPIGKRVQGSTRAAIRAGKEAGTQQFDEFDLNFDTVKEQASDLLEKALKALGSAGKAAAQAAKEKA